LINEIKAKSEQTAPAFPNATGEVAVIWIGPMTDAHRVACVDVAAIEHGQLSTMPNVWVDAFATRYRLPLSASFAATRDSSKGWHDRVAAQ
jgi:hypothetical protein